MNAKTKIRITYGALFLLLFAAELCIALFVKDKFIRPYVGDVLVIPLLCSLFRVIAPLKPRFLGLYTVLLGVVAEIMQLCHLDKMLGVEGTALGIILGSTFDIKDIICYVIGGTLFFILDEALYKKIRI